MGWFKDLTGVSSRDATGAVLTGGLSLLAGKDNGVGSGNKMSGIIRQGLRQGADAASGLTFNADGTLITPEYRGPGDITRNAMAAYATRAGNDPLQDASEGYLTDVLAGGTNPYLDRMFDAGANKIRSKLDSQFEAAGRYGSTDHEIAMGRALGEFSTDLYGGQYNQDQARMMQAAQIAPGIGYQGLNRQLQIGGMYDDLANEEANWQYDEGMRRINDFLTTIGAVQATRDPATPEPDRFSQAMQLLTAVGSTAGAFMGG